MPLIKEKIIDDINSYSLISSIKHFHDLEVKPKRNTAIGLSPFKSEKTPSFHVNESKRVWKCFGTGTAGKTVIDFVMKKENISFPEAVEQCARALNIVVEYEEETEEGKARREERKTKRDIINKAFATYRKNFEETEIGWAKAYMMEERGFTEETLELFDIGYAYNNNSLSQNFKEFGVLLPAEEVGICKRTRNGSDYYDFFRDRIIFPIFDHKADCVGFGGRANPTADKNKIAKYLNSPESDLYHKEDVLYGYHLAKKEMRSLQEVFLVEGYTDVMRMHQIGITNTVASCGTSLTVGQIKLIKQCCNKVILFRDGDEAGEKATKRDLDLLLQHGFYVEIVVMEEKGQDPDTLGRSVENPVAFIESHRKDAILHQIDTKYNEFQKIAEKEHEQFVIDYQNMHGRKPRKKTIKLSPENTDKLIKYSVDILGKFKNKAMQDRYKEMLVNRCLLKKVDVDNALKEKQLENQKAEKKQIDWNDFSDMYEFPTEITDATIDDYISDIKAYGLFQHNNQIYFMVGETAPYHFASRSNFSIEIIQHMQDEKYPMKLIRLKNVHNYEKIFDLPSDRINTLQGFKNSVSAFGNYFFSGSANELEKLLKYLFDKMGLGRKIEILGWQSEGFWVWNNMIVIPNQGEIPINKEGIFKHEGESYYIPSANSVYETANYKYEEQKKFRSINSPVSLSDYLLQIKIVHREHAITSILFGIASLFQDIVVKETGSFPLLFFFGPGSTGKDNLADAIQSFCGVPQTAINLEGNASTIKANILEFAKFNNGISQLSEYKRGIPKLDGVLKGLWDRRGYKRGSIESRIATDTISIASSTIMTGNEYPDAEALISRLVVEEIEVNTFSNEQKREYDKLKNWTKAGISSLSNSLIHKRGYFKEEFIETYRECKYYLTDLQGLSESPSRMIENLAVLMATYTLFEKYITFPFSKEEMLKHFIKINRKQRTKISTASPFAKFWECFLACLRIGNGEYIDTTEDLREEGHYIYFNFTNIYLKIQRQWYLQYHEPAPQKSDIKNLLQNNDAFAGKVSAIKINKKGNPTSAMKIDVNKLTLKDEIFSQINIQRGRLDFRYEMNNEQKPKNDEKQAKLPF